MPSKGALFSRSVVAELLSESVVHPRFYDETTIFFSIIIGFADYVSNHPPIKVTEYLNFIFTSFDHTLTAHDAYKVETIADCYMVGTI